MLQIARLDPFTNCAAMSVSSSGIRKIGGQIGASLTRSRMLRKKLRGRLLKKKQELRPLLQLLQLRLNMRVGWKAKVGPKMMGLLGLVFSYGSQQCSPVPVKQMIGGSVLNRMGITGSTNGLPE